MGLTYTGEDMTRGQSIVAISVGNTRTQIGQFEQGELQHSERVTNDDLAGVVQAVTARWKNISGLPGAAILLASVNDPFAERLLSAIEGQLSVDVYRVGEDVPIPIG